MAWRGLRLAVGTLSVLPAGAVGEIDRPTAARAMLVAPLAVLPLAAVASGAGWMAQRTALPPLAVGLIVVGVLALGTRAMHLDGLADTVDGLGTGWDRDRALAVMRRGDSGPMGVVALVLLLALQAAAAGQLVRGLTGAAAFALVVCGSRAAVALACVRGVPAARPDGLGAAVAGSVPRTAAVAVWIVVAGGLALACRITGRPWLLGVVAAALAAVVVVGLVAHCVRRLGGVTGDVLGASIEVAFLVLLLTLGAW
jgi:adenosylcobinamide-GDP ribazoletransferase